MKRYHVAIYALIAIFGLLVLIGSSKAEAAMSHCYKVCKTTLDQGHGQFTSTETMPEGSEVSINVFTSKGQIPIVSASGCKAVFRGMGTTVKAAICEPGYSHLKITYLSTHSPVQVLYQTNR